MLCVCDRLEMRLTKPFVHGSCSGAPRPFSASRRPWVLVVVLLLGTASRLHAATATASWDANAEPDVTGYALSYGIAPGVHPTLVDVGNVTSYQISGLTPGIRYYFVVQAYNGEGLTSDDSAEVFFDVPSEVFTDTPLIAGANVIRIVHIVELRTRIDAQRIRNGLTAYAWSDPDLAAGLTPIRAQHIVELRTALSEVYVALHQTPVTYTDPDLVAGMSAKAAHITEIRAGVIAVE